MASGITKIETISCGEHCTFGIGLPWSSPPMPEPEREHHYWHYGFREHLDHQVIAEWQVRFPSLRVELWPTKPEKTEQICAHLESTLRERVRIHPDRPDLIPATIRQLQEAPYGELNWPTYWWGAEVTKCAYWCTGSGDMVRQLLADPGFKRAWENAIEKIAREYTSWK